MLGSLLAGWNSNGLRKIPHSLELELSFHEAHNRRAGREMYVSRRKPKASDNCNSAQQREGINAPITQPIIYLECTCHYETIPVKGFNKFCERMWICFKAIFHHGYFRTTFTCSSFFLNFAFLQQVGQFNSAENAVLSLVLSCRVEISGSLGPCSENTQSCCAQLEFLSFLSPLPSNTGL